MAISFPRDDVLTQIGVVSQSFTLLARNELSRQSNGVTIPKRLGSSIWVGEWASKDKLHDKALDFEAIVNSLDDGLRTFHAYDTRRRMPFAYPTGNFNDSGILASVHASMLRVVISSLPANFQITRGDYFCYLYSLGGVSGVAYHQFMETVTAGPGGNTGLVEVRPHIRPGYIANTTPVILKNPYGLFKLFPQTTEFATANLMQSNASIRAYQDVV